MELEAHSSIMMKFADNKVYIQVSWNNSAKRMKLIMPTTKEAKRKTRISKVPPRVEKSASILRLWMTDLQNRWLMSLYRDSSMITRQEGTS